MDLVEPGRVREGEDMKDFRRYVPLETAPEKTTDTEIAKSRRRLVGYRTSDGKLWHPADVEIVFGDEPYVAEKEA